MKAVNIIIGIVLVTGLLVLGYFFTRAAISLIFTYVVIRWVFDNMARGRQSINEEGENV